MSKRCLPLLLVWTLCLRLWLPDATALAANTPTPGAAFAAQETTAEHPSTPNTTPDITAAAPKSIAFLHVATAANTTGHITTIDHPATNNNPGARLFVTPNWNPGGVGGVYNDHAVGVWYDPFAGRWTIYNQDLTSLPTGAAFNVLVALSGANVFVHQATAANTIINLTTIENALTNEKPNALLFVTPNFSAGAEYNPHPLHVYYNTAGKWVISNQNGSNMPVGIAFNVLVLEAGADAFVHKTTADNASFNTSTIDHPNTNQRPNRFVFITQNWTPGGIVGATNAQHVGVWYDTDLNKMSIFNQNVGATMPLNAGFNVYAPTVDTGAFVHRAVAGNITGQITALDHPLLNDNPYAVIFATPNRTPADGAGSVNNNHHIGVYYDGGRWRVFNQDFATMPTNAGFNILAPSPGVNVFIHRATAANITEHTTAIDHPLTNNNPNARLLVTPNWKADSGTGVYNDHPIGVYYAGGRWRIFNQDLSAIPVNAAFNVMVLPEGAESFVHTASAGTIEAQSTYMTNQRTNGNPAALAFITANWNPNGVGGVYNAHPIGVAYDTSSSRWAVYNQDLAAMPGNAAFNVYVVGSKVYAPVINR